jgi:hypothetical protein
MLLFELCLFKLGLISRQARHMLHMWNMKTYKKMQPNTHEVLFSFQAAANAASSISKMSVTELLFLGM